MIGISAATFLLITLPFVPGKCWADPANPADPKWEFVRDFSANHIVTRLAKSVGLLELFVSKSLKDPSYCTAVIIDTQTILTDAHCLEDKYGSRMKIYAIRFRMNYLSHHHKGDTYRVDTKPIEIEDNPDYALLKIVDPLPSGIVIAAGLLSLEFIQDKEEFIILQHPEGKPMVATRFFCRPRDPAEPPNEPFPGVLRNAIREVAGLRHSCDTMKGSSGAPIFMERTGLLVGIQRLGGLSEDPQTFNGATPFDTILEKSDVLTGVMTTTASNSSAKEALE